MAGRIDGRPVRTRVNYDDGRSGWETSCGGSRLARSDGDHPSRQTAPGGRKGLPIPSPFPFYSEIKLFPGTFSENGLTEIVGSIVRSSFRELNALSSTSFFHVNKYGVRKQRRDSLSAARPLAGRGLRRGRRAAASRDDARASRCRHRYGAGRRAELLPDG